jgi:hypothetical protein
VAQFAELFRNDGRWMIGIYGSDSEEAIDLPPGVFLAAIGTAIARLEG